MDTETVLTLVFFVWGIAGCFFRLAAYTWVIAFAVISLIGIVDFIMTAREFNATCDRVVDKLQEDLASGKVKVTRENADLMIADYTRSGHKSAPDDYPYFLGG